MIGVGVRRAALIVVLTASACGGRAAQQAPTTTRARPPTTPAPTTTTRPPSSTSTSTTAPPASTTTAPAAPALRITRGDPTRRRVAFTFDAGSDVGRAPEILDILARNHITASFGLTGAWVRANPDAARRITAAGHHVMNHTDTHPSFTGVSTRTAPLPTAQRRAQLERADATIRFVTGRTTRPWFRPPYGDTDASVDADVGAIGYSYEVLWTVDSLGWQGLAPAAVVDRCLDRAQNGAIYLFHVGSASTDATALQGVIDGLRARGYAIGDVPSVL